MTGQQSSVEFIGSMIDTYNSVVAPDIGVTKGFDQPYFSTCPDALAPMACPANAPVPTAITITNRERSQLGQGARAFFRGVMRPTIKHV